MGEKEMTMAKSDSLSKEMLTESVTEDSYLTSALSLKENPKSRDCFCNFMRWSSGGTIFCQRGAKRPDITWTKIVEDEPALSQLVRVPALERELLDRMAQLKALDDDNNVNHSCPLLPHQDEMTKPIDEWATHLVKEDVLLKDNGFATHEVLHGLSLCLSSLPSRHLINGRSRSRSGVSTSTTSLGESTAAVGVDGQQQQEAVRGEEIRSNYSGFIKSLRSITQERKDELRATIYALRKLEMKVVAILTKTYEQIERSTRSEINRRDFAMMLSEDADDLIKTNTLFDTLATRAGLDPSTTDTLQFEDLKKGLSISAMGHLRWRLDREREQRQHFRYGFM